VISCSEHQDHESQNGNIIATNHCSLNQKLPMFFYQHCYKVVNIVQLNQLHVLCVNDTPSNSLMDSTTSLKVKTSEGEGVGVCSLTNNILWVERHVGASKWD
jgi:hypothetical protein